jgi:proteasome lid subunit RPN8/RPN11
MKDHHNEEASVLVGHRRDDIWHGRLRQRWTGEPTSVAFDWSWTLEREERYGDVVGFYHTHPTGLASPSERDVRTMRAWVSCLGKPLLCLIQSGDNLGATLFRTDTDNGQKVSQVARFPRRVIVAVL